MRRRNDGFYRVGLTAVACALALSPGCDAPKPGAGPALVKKANAAPAAASDTLREPVESAHDYVLRALDANGRFRYLVDPDDPVRASRYNVLRHGGTVYALGDHYRRHEDPRTREAIGRATRYLVAKYVRAPRDKPQMLAVFSRPEEETLGTGKPEAKLGGAALGILALHAAKTAGVEGIDVEVMRKLGRFVLYMQREDGSFHSKFSEDEGFLKFQSLYYPGEAILALVKLYEVDEDIAWLEGAARGAAYLVRSRQGVKHIPNDHWLMLAMEPLLARYDRLPTPPIERSMLQEHATRLAKTMVRKQDVIARRGGPRGAFSDDGSCTPAATRLEGLVAVWRSMESWGDPEERAKFRESIRDGIAFLRTCQVEGGVADGGIQRAQKQIPGEGKRFNERQNEVRIDYVQHALSAMNGASDAL